jgi:hypothetical protein
VLVLDSWSDPFPPNTGLPNTQQPVLFTGDYCDGIACPPDPFAHYDHWDAGVIQPGLAGILPGAEGRRFDLSSYGYQNGSARIDPTAHRLLVSTAEVTEHYVHDLLVTANETNLVALGLEAFRCDVQGTMSAGQPLFVEVSLFGPLNAVASARARIEAPGVLTIPLDQFTPLNGFSYEHVTNVEFSAGDCMRDEDCGISQGPMIYSVGPLELVSAPTPARAASWGSVKGLYR